MFYNDVRYLIDYLVSAGLSNDKVVELRIV